MFSDCYWYQEVSQSFKQKGRTSEKASVSPSSTSWSSVSTRMMLGRMFFRSCCIRPLNLGDLMLELKLPSSCVPRTAKTRVQQEYFIVLAPMSQNWENVSLLILAGLGSQRKGRAKDENEIQTLNTAAEKGLQLSENWHINWQRKGCPWVRSSKPSQRRVVVFFLSAWLFCKFTFVLYSHSNFSNFKIHCQNRISSTELRCKSFLTRANTWN